MEQMYACGLFKMEQMNHSEDYSKQDRTVPETTKYFKELVGSIDKNKNKTVVHRQASMVLRVQQISRREKE